MEDLINRYKKQLKDRVSLKKTLNKTEEQIILDNFKYFDLNSTNFSNVNDFIKVNERIGVKMRSRDELVKVFSYYDNNNLGLINYRIFSKQILTSFPLENNFVDEKYNDFPYPNFTYDKIRSRRDNYIMRNKTSKDNYIFKCNYNDAQSNNLKSISNNYNTNLNNGAYTKKYSSYNNYLANNGEQNNYNSNYNKEENHYNKYESFDYKINGNEMGIISKNPNYIIPLKDQPFYGKLMSYLLNNSNLPSKTLLLLYKNFKINQKSKLYNKISVEDFMDIITKNRINLQVKEIQTLFYIYQNQKDGKFYYENFFDDLIDLYWNIERFNFTKNKIREILRKNRNRDKFMENNKITVEDFYNLISITKNNNYNIIAVNNYFKNKLNISYPDEYYNELVRIFMEIKYLSTTNKDSSLNDKDLLQLIKFISFGIKSNEDFYTAINYIFNTNKYSTIDNTKNKYQNESSEKKENKEKNIISKYSNSQRNFADNKFNYNTSLSSLIIIRKYMIENGIKTFVRIIKELNYYSNGNRFVKKYDFAKVLKDFNIVMTVNDIEQIFDIFCDDKKKLYLNYYKFIDILLDEFISKQRLNLIKDIYGKVEKYLRYIGHYEVNIEALKDIYNPKSNYYQYDEQQALDNFYENYKGFHFEFYIRKLYGLNGKRYDSNENRYEQNFEIKFDEFVEFYKMVSFIIEKDDVFRNIILNEWSNALNQNDKDKDTTNNIKRNDSNGKIDEENYNRVPNNKNSYRNDDYDDYDEYSIKRNNLSPQNYNYTKLKKDLTMSPCNDHLHNHIHNHEHIQTEEYMNKVSKIPINSLKNRNKSKDFSTIERQKRILRPYTTQKVNNLNRTFDYKKEDQDNDFNYNSNINVNKNINGNNYDNANDNTSPLEKLTTKLKMRGLRGLMNLHKQFLFTCNNLSLISFSNFVTVLKNQKISLEINEYKQIFSKFRKENTKYLNFPKFIREFKKPLNEKRLEAVEDAFAKLDVDSNDNVFIDTIKRKYNPRGDPLILKGVKNEEEVSTEFLDCFELNYNLLTAVDNQNVTNVVSFEEFANFYEYVSFLYDNDSEFIQLVNDSWDE